jgi:hypothetical protein
MTAVEVIRFLRNQGEDVYAENFSKIFDEHSIAYLFKAMELENRFMEYSKNKSSMIGNYPEQSNVSEYISECSIPAPGSSTSRVKDPVKKFMIRKIDSMVRGSICTARNEKSSNPHYYALHTEDMELNNYKPQSQGDVSHEPNSKSIKDIDSDDFLDENNLGGLEVLRAEGEQEFMSHERSATAVPGSKITLQSQLFEISLTLNEMKNAEEARVLQIYNQQPLTISLVGDLMVLLSCLFGKGVARKTVETWVYKKTGEVFNQAADVRKEKRRIDPSHNGGADSKNVDHQVEEIKKMVRDFYTKLD